MVLRTAGTNCNEETALAFESSGAVVEQAHINRFAKGELKLGDFHILALSGGFSYGDDIAAGRILGNELRVRLWQDVRQFISDGKLILGVCNGFQILAKAGILPWGIEQSADEPRQDATLTTNDSGKFEDRWVHLKPSGRSVWTEGIERIIYLPVAHAEGKFIPADAEVLKRLKSNGQIVFRYCTAQGGDPVYPESPNGAVEDIAGISDPSGRILGLMPHPERHFLFQHHPNWTRLTKTSEYGDGARIFENGVRYIQNNLL